MEATMIFKIVGFIFTAIGAFIATIVTAVFYALALPTSFLYALASAVWRGEVRSFESEDDSENDADEDLDSFIDKTDAVGQVPQRMRNRASESVGAKHSVRLPTLRRRPHPDREIAERSYYFGPSLKDLIDSIKAVWFAAQHITGICRSIVERTEDYEWPIINILANLAIEIGIVLGAFLGAAGVLVLVVLLGLIDVITSLAALCVGCILRALDAAMRYATGVTLTCPGGHKVVPYPYYHCPNPDCNTVHRDIRPGRYGITIRQCTCGRRLPTMLLTGAGNLAGVCRFCQTGLPPRFGLASEIVIPIYGAVNAGKTRLMYMLATELIDRVSDRGGKVHYIEDASERLASIRDAIRFSSNTASTPPLTPRGLGLDIQVELNRKVVYFFDAAGEMFRREETLAAMKFFNKARTYIHVADPLSSGPLRQRLNAAGKGSASSSAELDEVYQRVADHMLRLPQQKRRANLAFVVSKKDVLESCGVQVDDRDVAKLVSDPCGLDMADAIRAASQRFADTRYFATAALEVDGEVDSSVALLLAWILDAEGVKTWIELA
jgi:hypothetical protein